MISRISPLPARRQLLSAALAAVACATLSACSSATIDAVATADGWPGCDAFQTQAEAQHAWRQAGRPSQADGDHDGRVCEALPTTASTTRPDTCIRSRRIVDVGLSSTKYAAVVDHMRDAIAAGHPAVLTINRVGADDRRDALLAGIPTRPGRDRDEYPPALARGRSPIDTGVADTDADVRLVPSDQNRGAGSVLGIKLRRYCDGVRFQIVAY